MTAYLFTLPRARPLSDDGEILPGSYMQFYDSGTTTPTDVYADAGLTTPLDNPVVADADGRFVAIYLNPLTTYRVQLYDQEDVLLDDTDPYAPPRDYQPGTVLMFYGTEGELEAAYPPALWQQLDGNNGAPDIRDRFPIGVSSTLDPGDTGGSSTPSTSAAGGHDHGGDTGETSITEAQMPTHDHGGWYNTGFERGVSQSPPGPTDRSGVVIPGSTRNDSATLDSTGNSSEASSGLTNESGDGDPHDHSIASVSDHTHTVSVNPPYLALWFIMRRDV